MSLHVDFPHHLNLRDVGGHPTESGKPVARRRLFRSAVLSSLSDADRDELVSALGVDRIVDLRTPFEVAAEAVVNPRCESLHLPLFVAVRPDWDHPPFGDPRTTARRYVEMVRDGRSGLSQVLRLLRRCRSHPTLIHCHAGRDRTGIVIALVLDLLGVHDDVIAADYALSSVVDDSDGRRADPKSIRHFLRMIRADYGSTRQMVTNMGVEERELEELLQALLQ